MTIGDAIVIVAILYFWYRKDKIMAYLEELLPEFRKGTKIRRKSWESTLYIEQQNREIKTNKGEILYLGLDYLNDDTWELYQEPIDWDYIIKNDYPCWFWDDIEDKALGTLSEFSLDYTSPFGMRFGGYWKNCRPVRKDEVTFYEDKEDE